MSSTADPFRHLVGWTFTRLPNRLRQPGDALLPRPRARVVTDLPASLAALPADLAAPTSPLAAELAACFACPRLSSAALPCLVAAAFVPRLLDAALALFLLRALVAAAFFAAALRSAFV